MMYPEKIIAPKALNTAVVVDPRGKKICIKLVRRSTMRLVNRIGPRKLKSLPFLLAQKVYPVRAETTAAVKIKASSTILPSVFAHVTPTVRLREAVNSPRNTKFRGCLC